MNEAEWLVVDPERRLKAPALVELLHLWQVACGDRQMPARSDFSPAMLREHLGWIVLVEVEPTPQRFRYRLVGAELTDRIGRDSSGQYLDELYGDDVYGTAVSGYRAAIAARQPVRAHGRFLQAEKGHLRFESLDMPLSNDGRTVSMIMSRDVILRS